MNARTYWATGSPKYKTNIINSLPAILLDGGYYIGYFPADDGLLTWFLVCKFTSLSNSYTGVVGWNPASDYGGYFVKSNGKSAVYMPSSSYDGAGSATFNTTDFNIISCRHGVTSISTRRNESVDYATGAPKFSTITSTMLGNQAISGRQMSGYIAEFIVYRGQLSDAEIVSVEGYLATKYAL
jgi:hypothetical protein